MQTINRIRRWALTLSRATAALLLPTLCSAVPVYVLKQSNDAWASRPGTEVDYTGCKADSYVPFAVVPGADRAKAVDRLQNSASARLSDTDAIALLGMERSSSGSLATQILNMRIKDRSLERDSALAARAGSWSRSDQNALAEISSLVASGYGDKLRPYLIRALGVDRNNLDSEFQVRLCGEVLEVTHFSMSDTWSEPDRLPMVVFLEVAPKAVLVLTGISSPASGSD